MHPENPKIKCEAINKQSILECNKSPDPFKDNPWKAKLCSFIANKVDLEKSLKASDTCLAFSSQAYQDFLISLFESICFMRQMSPFGQDFPLELQLNLAKPNCCKLKKLMYRQENISSGS